MTSGVLRLQGRTGLIVGMLQEVFEVYVMKPLRKKAPQCLRWMRSVLQQYKRPFLNDEEINELKLNRLWHLVQVSFRIPATSV